MGEISARRAVMKRFRRAEELDATFTFYGAMWYAFMIVFSILASLGIAYHFPA